MLKIGDDKGKWHYLALPSNVDEDEDQKIIYLDYLKAYRQKVTVIFIAMGVYTLFELR